MAADFGYCWRTVRLYCPSAPTFLAREWVNAAYKQLLAARHWGFLRTQLTITCDGVNPLVTLPADFGGFEVVVDQSRQRRISYTHSLADLARCDPGIIATGQPGALIATGPSTDPSTYGQAQYRVYPLGSATLTAVYNRQADRLTDTSVFTGVLAGGGEVLVAGALAQAALWPGTGEKPNPYFNGSVAQAKAQEFRTAVQALSLRDDEQYPADLWDYWDYATCGCLSTSMGSPDYRATDFPAPTYW